MEEVPASLSNIDYYQEYFDDIPEDDSFRYHGCGSAPANPISVFLRGSRGLKLLSKDEERAWFQIIEAASERINSLFSRYPFASEMYIRELEHLASGKQHFDSVISESSRMSCASYKKAIPEFLKGISDAVDMLIGASTLHREIQSSEASEMLRSAYDEVRRRLEELSFRQSVVEDLCDIAYEDIYLPWVKRIKDGEGEKYDIDDVFRMFGMTAEEFVESFAEVKSALDIINMARSRIAESNLRLVVHVAKKYVNRGMELADLLQDGSMGLMNAIRKFDMSRGHKFSTFATWWIRQAISRSLTNNSRTIRIPSHKIDQINKLGKVERDLFQSLHRVPTIMETAKAMSMSQKDVNQLCDIRQQTSSLDGAVEEGGASLVNIIGDDRIVGPDKETEKMLVRDVIHHALLGLTEREKMVIEMRFGLSDGAVRTLEEIGRLFNVTREHIRQVELEALSKLRTSGALTSLVGL